MVVDNGNVAFFGGRVVIDADVVVLNNGVMGGFAVVVDVVVDVVDVESNRISSIGSLSAHFNASISDQ